ncbi:sensor histidine kinase [Hymenobacter bucti]|uniref:histidine kinase n=1 Tax=Hymenobacter bucti TaxID=1844114 RepID=A0ABW4R1M3_9BACT
MHLRPRSSVSLVSARLLIAPGAPDFPAAPFLSEGVLRDLLVISLTGVNVLRPVYGPGPAGAIEDFDLVYLSPAGQRMTGLAERPDGTLLTRFPHTDVAGILGYYRRVYLQGDLDVYEVNYQADGLDNYFRLVARRSGDWLVVSFTDTSDQDRSAVEQALRESQAREQAARTAAEHQRNELRELVAQAPVAVAVYRGPQYRVTVANAATLAIWDRKWADVQDRPVFEEVLPEAADPSVVAHFDQVFTTGQPFTAHERPTIINRHGQPEVVYWNFAFQPSREPDGQIRGIISVGTDVSEQVRARQQVEGLNQELASINEELRATNGELQLANGQLTRTNADLDNFIYTASHDLKQPIANIESLLHALDRELPPAALVGDVPEMLRLMQQATEHFRRTVEQLTDVSKLQQAHAQPATPVLLATVVADVRLDLLPLVQQTQGWLVFDVPAAVRVPFSEQNLHAVVYNLLSNALKYRHPDRAPEVRFTYFRQDQQHVLQVQDNGLGFDVAQAEGKLFGLFQRLHTHVEGTGIGLYMVKKMVENSDGRIEVASQPGKGSTFTVFLPVHPVS